MGDAPSHWKVPFSFVALNVAPAGRLLAASVTASPSVGVATTWNWRSSSTVTNWLPIAPSAGGTSTPAAVVTFVVAEYGLLDETVYALAR